MEKILKRILIPFLFVILTIKSAYAETIDLYSSGNQYITFTSVSGFSYDNKYSIDMFDDNFNFNLRTDVGTNFINSVLYFLPDSNQYLLLNFFTTSDVSNNNFDINLDFKTNTNNFYCYWYYNSSDEKVQNCVNTATGWGSFTFITKTYSLTWYSQNVNYDISYLRTDNFSPYTSVFYYNIGVNKSLDFVFNNQDKLQFVKVLRGNFYIQGQLIGSASGESPEVPDPEEPEIPIFNENLNKFYVPNYEKGQCVEVLDKDTLRVFNDENTDFYTDYYINSNYISKTGQVDIDYQKNCSQLEFTDIRYYGNDFPQILFILFCITIFSIGIPYILYKRFRKR